MLAWYPGRHSFYPTFLLFPLLQRPAQTQGFNQIRTTAGIIEWPAETNICGTILNFISLKDLITSKYLTEKGHVDLPFKLEHLLLECQSLSSSFPSRWQCIKKINKWLWSRSLTFCHGWRTFSSHKMKILPDTRTVRNLKLLCFFVVKKPTVSSISPGQLLRKQGSKQKKDFAILLLNQCFRGNTGLIWRETVFHGENGKKMFNSRMPIWPICVS